jgi:hypothetical protein
MPLDRTTYLRILRIVAVTPAAICPLGVTFVWLGNELEEGLILFVLILAGVACACMALVRFSRWAALMAGLCTLVAIFMSAAFREGNFPDRDAKRFAAKHEVQLAEDDRGRAKWEANVREARENAPDPVSVIAIALFTGLFFAVPVSAVAFLPKKARRIIGFGVSFLAATVGVGAAALGAAVSLLARILGGIWNPDVLWIQLGVALAIVLLSGAGFIATFFEITHQESA